jgi:o-succinylbenzoate---CoA ligase
VQRYIGRAHGIGAPRRAAVRYPVHPARYRRGMASDRPRLLALDLPLGRALVAALERAAAAGDAVLPLDAAAPAAARRRLLDALRPDAVVGADGAEVALPDPLPTPPATAVVIATSGSTGAPKGVSLSRDALAASAAASADRLGGAPGDRWLACLPAHHIGGFSVLWRSRLAGTAPAVLPGFDVEAVARALPDVALVALVPTQLRRLLDAGAPLAALRAVLLGGARADAALLARAASAGVRVVTTYGMSETAGGCVYDGVPLDGVEVRLDDGVVALRGPTLLDGYRGDPVRTAAALRDGWFRTSDLGRFDDAGRLEVIGRADDVINSGGVKVVGGEVERVIAGLPGVAEAAVVGRPDPEWGERVVAAVIPVDAADPPTLAAVRDAVRAALGAPSAPKELLVLPDLPRLPTGKVDRLALRDG